MAFTWKAQQGEETASGEEEWEPKMDQGGTEEGQYSPIHQSKDVEHGSNIWVAPARCALQILQCLLTEWHGHLVATLSCILDHQVVQSP